MQAETVEQLPIDTYRVRWTLDIPGLAQIKEAGQQVRITEIVQSKTITINNQQVKVENLGQTASGLVPLIYLEPKSKKASKIENQVHAANPVHEDVVNGQWWMGRVSCIDVGLRLSRDPSLVMGSYAVCQPPEMEPIGTGEWAEFVLVVRNISGSVDQWVYEWQLNHKYNLRFGKKFKERQIGNDIIKGPPASPIPPIAYFIIKRTEDGMFYLVPEKTFPSIELLLSHYYGNVLPIDGKKEASEQPFSLVLRCISRFDTLPYTFPRPMLGGLKKPNYQRKDRTPIQLFLGGSQKSLKDFRARVAKRVIVIDSEQKEALYRGYLYYNGTYNVVTIRKLRPKLFNQKTFDKDIKRIAKVSQLSREGTPKQETSLGKIRNGYQFLSHIVGFGADPNEKYDKWIAYEFITGTPLDRFLQRRKYMNDSMVLREKSEILYQVSAGMRFLELNGLCHRHLRGSNIIVHEEGSHVYGVKITDYMVTYHFLDEESVKQINLYDLDWPWWAPESVLCRCFDIVSDVWAFGCVIFEINHDGLGPYAFQKHRPRSYNDLQAIFERGEQMVIVREDDAETFLEELLFMCIRYDPDTRPTFDHLFHFFRELLFDFAQGPDIAIEKYIKKVPKKFEHPQRSSLIKANSKFLKKDSKVKEKEMTDSKLNEAKESKQKELKEKQSKEKEQKEKEN